MLQRITLLQHQFREGAQQQEGMMAGGGSRPGAGTNALWATGTMEQSFEASRHPLSCFLSSETVKSISHAACDNTFV